MMITAAVHRPTRREQAIIATDANVPTDPRFRLMISAST
jgi:hypothetical protein